MKGLVRIRLARFGRRHQPMYNIVVTKSWKSQRSLPIEVVGMYNPVSLPLSPQEQEAGELPVKDIKLDFLRSQYWLGVGAQPTPTVARLFKKAGLLPPEWPGPVNSTFRPPTRTVVRPREAAAEPIPPPVR